LPRITEKRPVSAVPALHKEGGVMKSATALAALMLALPAFPGMLGPD